MTDSIIDSLKNPSEKYGLPPGVLVHVGKVPDHECRISAIKYDQSSCEEFNVSSIRDLLNKQPDKKITWVIIEGLNVIETIETIGKYFDIHPLILEDILNTHQRPKHEDHDRYLFIVLKALIYNAENSVFEHEQLSMLIMDQYVFTFKETQDTLLDPLKLRLSHSKGHFRSSATDYLAYAICDTIVDNYMLSLDSMIDIIESIEEELLASPTQETLVSIQQTRRELIFVRKNILPIREVISEIQHSESTLINENTRIYFRDVYDHSLRVIESLDSYRELLNGMLEIYLSSVSNNMNEIMKVLTVFASIFIPLTFIAGIYGMNFDYMPELKWKWAYPTLWILFVTIPIVLLIYFKNRKWL
jgi:magnesium transporter